MEEYVLISFAVTTVLLLFSVKSHDNRNDVLSKSILCFFVGLCWPLIPALLTACFFGFGFWTIKRILKR